jgi:hypothetical protein
MDTLAPKGLGFLLYGERVEGNLKGHLSASVGGLVGSLVGPFFCTGSRVNATLMRQGGRTGGSSLLASLVGPLLLLGVCPLSPSRRGDNGHALMGRGGRKGGLSSLAPLVGPLALLGVSLVSLAFGLLRNTLRLKGGLSDLVHSPL